MKINASIIPKNVKIGIAVSGGMDSMALLHYLNARTSELEIEITVINVDHGLRGGNSVSDSAFVARYCMENNIRFIQKTVGPSRYLSLKGSGTENAAREMRYAVFDGLLETDTVGFVLTAHHASDAAETVLLHLFRGSGTHGLSGIPEASGKYLRPMLSVKKRDIEKYVAEYNIPYVTDETNADNNFSRNLVRNKILPLAQKINPSATEAINNFSRRCAEDDSYLSSLVPDEAVTVTDEGSKLTNWALNAPQPLFVRAVYKAFNLLEIFKDVENAHIDMLTELRNMRAGSGFDFKNSVRAVRDYDGITLIKNEIQNTERKIQDTPAIPFGFGKFLLAGKTFAVEECKIADKIKSGRNYPPPAVRRPLFFDAGKIPENSVFRTRRDGDIITKFGGGTVKLKDYLIALKIPARKRDGLVLLASGGSVLLIAGVEISDAVKLTRETANIGKISIMDL